MPAGTFMRVGGPETGGTGDFLHCDGTNWQSFLRYSSSGEVYMLGGNIGIGTTSPGALLDLGRQGSVRGNMWLRADATNGAYMAWFSPNGNFYDLTATDSHLLIHNDGAGDQLALSSSGNVGIGTTSPKATLDVQGAIRTTSDAGWANTGAGLSMGYNVTGGYTQMNSYDYGTSAYKKFLIEGNPLVLNSGSGGNVGIGTTNPTYTLQVNGSVAGTSAYNNTSDARLKKDVTEISDGLGMVERLRGVHFHWRTPEERPVGKGLKLPVADPQVGFIAQEVQKVLPEAVTKGEDGIYTMEESKIVPVLVEAVKELKADNDNQQAEIKDLRARLDAFQDGRAH